MGLRQDRCCTLGVLRGGRLRLHLGLLSGPPRPLASDTVEDMSASVSCEDDAVAEGAYEC